VSGWQFFKRKKKKNLLKKKNQTQFALKSIKYLFSLNDLIKKKKIIINFLESVTAKVWNKKKFV